MAIYSTRSHHNKNVRFWSSECRWRWRTTGKILTSIEWPTVEWAALSFAIFNWMILIARKWKGNKNIWKEKKLFDRERKQYEIVIGPSHFEAFVHRNFIISDVRTKCVIKCIIWLMGVLAVSSDRHIIRHIWMQMRVCVCVVRWFLIFGNETVSAVSRLHIGRINHVRTSQKLNEMNSNDLVRGKIYPFSHARCAILCAKSQICNWLVRPNKFKYSYYMTKAYISLVHTSSTVFLQFFFYSFILFAIFVRYHRHFCCCFEEVSKRCTAPLVPNKCCTVETSNILDVHSVGTFEMDQLFAHKVAEQKVDHKSYGNVSAKRLLQMKSDDNRKHLRSNKKKTGSRKTRRTAFRRKYTKLKVTAMFISYCIVCLYPFARWARLLGSLMVMVVEREEKKTNDEKKFAELYFVVYSQQQQHCVTCHAHPTHTHTRSER